MVKVTSYTREQLDAAMEVSALVCQIQTAAGIALSAVVKAKQVGVDLESMVKETKEGYTALMALKKYTAMIEGGDTNVDFFVRKEDIENTVDIIKDLTGTPRDSVE